jgi:hypothetical protein
MPQAIGLILAPLGAVFSFGTLAGAVLKIAIGISSTGCHHTSRERRS